MFPLKSTIPAYSRRNSFVLCFCFVALILFDPCCPFLFRGSSFRDCNFIPSTLVECNNTERWRRRRHPIISRVNPPVHKTLENVYTYRIVSAAAATASVAEQQLWQRAVNCEDIYIYRKQFRLFGFYACMHLSQCKNIKAVTALETPTDAQGQCYTFIYVRRLHRRRTMADACVCIYSPPLSLLSFSQRTPLQMVAT